MYENRAQAHTLEAFSAALVLLAAVSFALQVTAVTPLTASTSSQHIENQHQAAAEGVLAGAAHDGALKPTLLAWNQTGGTFYGTTHEGTYTLGGPPTRLGRLLNRTFLERGVAFNLNVRYLHASGDRRERRIVHLGEPSDHAVSASRIVTLYDDDRLRDESGARGPPLSEDTYFAPDVAPNDSVYNVVVVEVVAWEM